MLERKYMYNGLNSNENFDKRKIYDSALFKLVVQVCDFSEDFRSKSYDSVVFKSLVCDH